MLYYNKRRISIFDTWNHWDFYALYVLVCHRPRTHNAINSATLKKWVVFLLVMLLLRIRNVFRFKCLGRKRECDGVKSISTECATRKLIYVGYTTISSNVQNKSPKNFLYVVALNDFLFIIWKRQRLFSHGSYIGMGYRIYM